jgi:hypothetical protein
MTLALLRDGDRNSVESVFPQARRKSDPVSLDTVLAVSTMTAAKEAGHARETAEAGNTGE